MRTIVLYLFTALMCSCGSGDTGDGYNADTTSLNPYPDANSNNSAEAGTRGNPAMSEDTGTSMNINRPDTDETNPNVDVR